MPETAAFQAKFTKRKESIIVDCSVYQEKSPHARGETCQKKTLLRATTSSLKAQYDTRVVFDVLE
jgi:hypothetical protein